MGALEKALKLANKVLVKPNLGVDVPSNTGVTTNPLVINTLVQILKEAGVKRVIVGECSIGYNAGSVFDTLGVKDVFEQARAEVVNMDADTPVEVEVLNGKVLEKLKIHCTAWESDFIISVHVMKIHFQTTGSLGMKNMKGTIPDSMKKIMHRIRVKELKYEFELEHAIVDLNTIIKPHLTVIDGITPQEGYNSASPGVAGSPVRFNAVVAGLDRVTTDATAAYLMVLIQWKCGISD
jgi:uncharacterized protein (DUF362 family)